MAEISQNILKISRDFLVLLTTELVAVTRTSLLPMAGFCWHSLTDSFELLNTSDNRRQLRRFVVAPLMRFERGLESLLPESFRHRQPIKTVVLILFILTLLLLGGDSGIDALKKSGELVVIARESATTLYRDNEGAAGPEYDYLDSFANFLGVELRFDIRDSEREVLDAISNDEGHIATTGSHLLPA